ncbi:MAG: fibronectin type III domain-containing protein, partial [Candidatus Poseidoniaceae archaeon]|nr:fibronectin type III domain-containing protein [Candidatus Poseidoniaceae archaeon]
GTTVNDGTGDDISYTGSDTTLSANWPAFTEDVSGVSHYEIGVDDGDGDYISWTSIGDTTTHTFTGLNLTNGTLYYVKVLAMDVAGNLSDVVSG